MKKKIVIGFSTLTISAIMAFINMTLNTNQEGGFSLLALSNINALAQSEQPGDHPPGGSTQVTCYSRTNNCWFWNCQTVYRCSVTQSCPEVSADDMGDIGYCYP